MAISFTVAERYCEMRFYWFTADRTVTAHLVDRKFWITSLRSFSQPLQYIQHSNNNDYGFLSTNRLNSLQRATLVFYFNRKKLIQSSFVGNECQIFQSAGDLVKSCIIIFQMRLVLVLSLVIWVAETTISSMLTVRTGKIVPLSSLTSTLTSPTYTFATTINPSMSPATKSVALSLIGFHSLMSVQFSFNTSVSSVTSGSMTVTVTPLSTSYFKILELHYIVTQNPRIQIRRGCYYCTNLLSGSGIRSQNFSTLTTALTGTIQHTTVLSGFKVNNTLGKILSIQVKSYIVNLPEIITEVGTQDDIVIEWFCVSLILYVNNLQPEIYFKLSSMITFIAGTSGISAYPTGTALANVMFFGISQLKLQMLSGNPGYRFQLTTQNPATPLSLTTNGNLKSLILEQFLFWNDDCMILNPATPYSYAGYTCSTVGCSAAEYIDSQNYCQSCSLGGNCLTCNLMGCASCTSTAPVFRTLVGTACDCISGYYDAAGTCLTCISALSNCTTCNSATDCTACQPPFTAVGGQCICPSNTYLIYGNCTTFLGCALANTITSGGYCQVCATDLLFEKWPDQTCACIAHTIFNNVTDRCEGVCNDSFGIGNICDDGDTISGNGCENNCTITPGYYCPPVNRTRSRCVPIANFTAKYIYAIKVPSQNTGILYFKLDPIHSSFATTDFGALAKTSIPNTKIKSTYSNGIVALFITYTESIEATDQWAEIDFDPTQVWATPIRIPVTPCGSNYQLTFNQLENFNNIISLLSNVIGAISLLFAIVSSALGKKLIGLETILPIQLSYFCLASLKAPPTSFGMLIGLNLSNGYNKIFNWDLYENLYSQPGLMVLQTDSEFVRNFNIFGALFLILFIIAGITRLWVAEVEVQTVPDQKDKKNKQKKKETLIIKDEKQLQNGQKQKKQQNKQGSPQKQPQIIVPVISKGEKLHYFILDRILISFWLLLVQSCIFFVGIQIYPPGMNSPINRSISSSIGIAFLILVLGGMVILYTMITQKDKHIQFHSRSRFYPFYLVCSYMLEVTLMTALFKQHSFALYILMPFSLIPIILIIRYKPHGNIFTFQSLVAIVTQLIPLITCLIFLIGTSNFDLALLLSLALLGTIFILEGLNITRVVLRMREDYLKIKKEEQKNKADKEENAIDKIVQDSIKNQLMNQSGDKMLNWQDRNQDDYRSSKSKLLMPIYTPRNKTAFRSKHEQADSEEEELHEEDELIKLKMRLKKELIDKRGSN